VLKKSTRQRNSLPSVKKTLGKESLCRVSKIKYLANSFFAECFFCLALGKELLCRVSEKALDKIFGTQQRTEFQ
jgi:hypothetical protein